MGPGNYRFFAARFFPFLASLFTFYKGEMIKIKIDINFYVRFLHYL